MLVFLSNQTPKIFAASICIEGLKDLQVSQAVIQDKGGLWGYLEKSSGMKDNSILGLQIDGKLQRLIVSFEELCADGKTPTPKLHSLILNLIGDARMIFNKDPDSQDKEKVLGKLKGLNKRIGDLLAQLPS
tara:strand:- start:277 stop:669 length:393 start_codon:yes stop_codon:yes gene_type:complete